MYAEVPAASALLFDSARLVPDAWRQPVSDLAQPRFRVFNPSLLKVSDGYAMVYRVVDEAAGFRRLASCLLSANFEIVAGSVTPLSDLIEFAAPETLDERAQEWHADPRFFRLLGENYLSWNDGGNKAPKNNQFLMRMNPEGLRPAGRAKALVANFPTRSIEKNWMFFEADNAAWVVYSICPLVCLSADLEHETQVTCTYHHESQWNNGYEALYGVLRGSAQPVRLDENRHLALAHSSFKTGTGRNYVACAYVYSSQPPFTILEVPSLPVQLPNPRGSRFELARLNPEVEEVVYPCGCIVEGDSLIVSYGVNDEVCAITRIAVADVLSTLESHKPSYTLFSKAVQIPADERFPAELSPTPLFWWDAAGQKFDNNFGARRFAVGNFGDIASADIISRITGIPVAQPSKTGRKLLAIGSVLHTAKDGDVVWGTGVKGSKMMLDPSVNELSVHAVRGPLTLDFLRRSGIKVSQVKELFDPGCLVPVLYEAEIASIRQECTDKVPFRIVPHYRDDLGMRRSYYRHVRNFVSVDTTPLDFVRKIIGAERVISSSLHGIIFAEALGIPAVWLAPSGGEDELKYYDYYYGTGRLKVRRCETVDEALLATPMALPRFCFKDYLDSFPRDEVLGLGAVPVIKLGESIDFAKPASPTATPRMLRWNLGHTGAEGLWAVGNSSGIKFEVAGTEAGQAFQIKLVARPFNPEQFRIPQELEVICNGEQSAVVQWAKGSTEPAEIAFTVAAAGKAARAELILRPLNVRSPKSLNLGDIEEQLTVCLSRLEVKKI